FKQPCANFLDGVSDRDYLCELIFGFSMILMHLSRLSESVILWCSQEFRFVTLSDAYSTGSSIMPQKKNPDGAELIRGCSGLVYGSLMAILTELKGIPLAYNKDMQLDKRAFMPALDDTLMCLEIMRGMIATMTVHPEAMKRALKGGFLNATELADYLVKRGVPFRDAHEVVGKAVLLCEERSCAIEEMPLEELQKLCPLIGPDVYEAVDYERTIRLGNKKEML
ncbi:MAG: argininosuccinate lyase, partial [Firmicutes bacterium]|nr:argininosuccinate lyase [Bacillota bacterium]